MVFLISIAVNVIGSEGGSASTLSGDDEIRGELTINMFLNIFAISLASVSPSTLTGETDSNY